jgi:hypothetical protein
LPESETGCNYILIASNLTMLIVVMGMAGTISVRHTQSVVTYEDDQLLSDGF